MGNDSEKVSTLFLISSSTGLPSMATMKSLSILPLLACVARDTWGSRVGGGTGQRVGARHKGGEGAGQKGFPQKGVCFRASMQKKKALKTEQNQLLPPQTSLVSEHVLPALVTPLLGL